MRIFINGEPRDVEDDLSLAELIRALDLRPEQIAIELNQTVIRRAHWQEKTLQQDDKLEIVHFVGGGGQREEGSRKQEAGGRRQEQDAGRSSRRQRRDWY